MTGGAGGRDGLRWLLTCKTVAEKFRVFLAVAPVYSFLRKSRLTMAASGGQPRRKADAGKMALYTLEGGGGGGRREPAP